MLKSSPTQPLTQWQFDGGIVSDRLSSVTGSSGNSNPNFRNCIFWENTASGTGHQFFNLGGATFAATYSDINLTGQLSPDTVLGSPTGKINTDPLFSNIVLGGGADWNWITTDDGLQLQSSSPCINVGDNTGVLTTDILSNNRIFNSVVDMGAYEFGSTVTSVTENNKLNIDVIMFPNPTSNLLNNVFKISETDTIVLVLFDINGRLVKTIDQGQKAIRTYNYQCDLSHTNLEFIFDTQNDQTRVYTENNADRIGEPPINSNLRQAVYS